MVSELSLVSGFRVSGSGGEHILLLQGHMDATLSVPLWLAVSPEERTQS